MRDNLLPVPPAVGIGPRWEGSDVKLLDQFRHVACLRRRALETERCYARWVEQYIRFHKTAEGFRRPNTIGAAGVRSPLDALGRMAAGPSPQPVSIGWGHTGPSLQSCHGRVPPGRGVSPTR